MDFSQINHILSKNSCTNSYFLGCVDLFNLCDFVHTNFDFNKPKNIIIVLLYPNGNKLPDPEQIGHYILLFWCQPSSCVVFDSMGSNFDSKSSKILKSVFLYTKVKTIEENTVQLQPTGSCTCGLYCILVALLLCEGKSLQEIVQSFDFNDRFGNDRTVYKFAKKHFNFISRKRLLYCQDLV